MIIVNGEAATFRLISLHKIIHDFNEFRFKHFKFKRF